MHTENELPLDLRPPNLQPWVEPNLISRRLKQAFEHSF